MFSLALLRKVKAMQFNLAYTFVMLNILKVNMHLKLIILIVIFSILGLYLKIDLPIAFGRKHLRIKKDTQNEQLQIFNTSLRKCLILYRIRSK